MSEDLFGGKPKVLDSITIIASELESPERAAIILVARTFSQRDPMQVTVWPGTIGNMGSVLGKATSVLHTGYYCGPETVRRKMWAFVRWAQQEGMEVETKRMGKPFFFV